MNTNYVLIDFENVQPKHLDRLRGFKVLVFVGPQQTKIPIEMASALQALGSGVEYIKLEKSGRNALDFSIAYYLGELSCKDAAAHFHIVSKDTGFDPLIHHLKGKKIAVKRYAGVTEIAVVRESQVTDGKSRIERVVKDLVRRKAAKPRTLKTLSNTIFAQFKKELAEQELPDLLRTLQEKGFISVEGGKVTYKLPENV